MDRETDRKELPTISDHALLYHTTHYERFFMLYVDFNVNGEKAELCGVDSKSLFLSAPSPPLWQISSGSLLSAANEAGKKYGIGHVAKLRCGHLLMMEVEFVGGKDIAEFLKSLSEGNFQECLETHLREEISVEVNSISLDVSLQLVVPLPECHASFTEVTLDNLKSCLETLEEGNNFNYTQVMTNTGVAYCRKGIYTAPILCFIAAIILYLMNKGMLVIT